MNLLVYIFLLEHLLISNFLFLHTRVNTPFISFYFLFVEAKTFVRHPSEGIFEDLGGYADRSASAGDLLQSGLLWAGG